MRKNALKICGTSLALGVFGAFMRWLQLLGAFESGTNLPVAGAWQSWAMLVYLLAAAVLLYFIVRPVREMSIPAEYPANIARFKSFYTIAAAVVSVLLAVGGVLTAIGSRGSVNFAFELILGVLAIAAAVCAFLFIFGAKKPEAKGGAFSVVLVVFACFWLIATYKDSSNDPVIWHFAIRILAVAASILGLYYITGYCYKRPKPFPAVYFSLLGVILNIITLSDPTPLGSQLISIGAALLLLIIAFAMIMNGDAAALAPEENGETDATPNEKTES